MFRRILNIRYLFYKAKICFKLLFIGLNIPFLFIKLHVFSPQKKRIKGVAIVLPKPLGLGDLSMISPVFELLKSYKPLTVLSNFEGFFENAPEWKTYDNLNALFREAKKSALAGRLLYIPKSSIAALRFVRQNTRLPIVAALSENIAIDTVKKKIFKLPGTASYTQKVIASTRFLADKSARKTRKRLNLTRNPVPGKISSFISKNSGRKIIILAPYAKWKARRWDMSKWSQLINQLSEHDTCSFIIIGSSPESRYGNEIISRVLHRKKTLNAMGQIEISQLRALFEISNRLISVDNGLMHLGVSCGIRTVAIFGCTPYQKRFAEHESAVAVQSYSSCHLAPCYTGYAEVFCPYNCQCIRDVTVEDVIRHIA